MNVEYTNMFDLTMTHELIIIITITFSFLDHKQTRAAPVYCVIVTIKVSIDIKYISYSIILLTLLL